MNTDALIGTKITQSSQFTENGKRIPVSSISVAQLFVVGTKIEEKDGYNAVILGLGMRRPITLSRPELGMFKKAGMDKNPSRFLQEMRLDGVTSDDMKNFTPGLEIKVGSIFQVGDMVQVTGISKGKGFAGGVKRHHFKGGSRTHGQSDRERAPGSIGQTTTPGRVYKGKRMAGRMGNDKVTVKNLKIIALDDQMNTIIVSGLIPGGKNGLVTIKNLKKK